MLTIVTVASFILLVVRRPRRKINLNYMEIYGTATEVASFALLMFPALDSHVTHSLDSLQSLPCTDDLFALVLLINQIAIYVMMALSVFDNLCKIKNHMKSIKNQMKSKVGGRARRAKKKAKVPAHILAQISSDKDMTSASYADDSDAVEGSIRPRSHSSVSASV